MQALLKMNLVAFGCMCLCVNDSWLKTIPESIPTLLPNQELEHAGIVKDEPRRFWCMFLRKRFLVKKQAQKAFQLYCPTRGWKMRA